MEGPAAAVPYRASQTTVAWWDTSCPAKVGRFLVLYSIDATLAEKFPLMMWSEPVRIVWPHHLECNTKCQKCLPVPARETVPVAPNGPGQGPWSWCHARG